MHKRILYKRAYRLLQNSTPLKYDCGQVCNNKCCQGHNNMGMCLYPGEETMLHQVEFLNFRNEKLGDKDVLFAVCNGTCDRDLRPLSCRIYPYTPYLNHLGKLSIIPDPRAKYHCPLLMTESTIKIDKFFIRNMYKVFHTLIHDHEIRDFIHCLSTELDEYKRFTNM